MARLTIRLAIPSDAAAVARVHVASWREAYKGLLPQEVLVSPDESARRLMWASILSDPSSASAARVLVLENEDHTVGFGAFGDQRSAELRAVGYDGEIGAIYILSAAQGFGAGRLLMGRMASLLSEAGKRGVSLWVLAENRKACGFYERLGGQLVGERKDLLPQGVLVEVAYGWPDLGLLTI